MNIQSFVQSKGITMRVFAESASMSRPELSRLATSARYGTLDQHIRLYQASGGAITPTDLMLAHPAYQAAAAPAAKPGHRARRPASGRASKSSRKSKPSKKRAAKP
jgi:hypothetical protein